MSVITVCRNPLPCPQPHGQERTRTFGRWPAAQTASWLLVWRRVGIRRALVSIAVLSVLTGCQQSVQGKQLDINYATTMGVGSTTSDALNLPHGRYTFFASEDPPRCIQGIALIDPNGSAIIDDASQRRPVPSPPAGVRMAPQQMIPTIVQQEFPSGRYRLRVKADDGCAWRVEQILNYVLSNEPPLKAAPPPAAPPLDVILGNVAPDLHVHIDTPGIYDVRWSVTPCASYSLDLTRPGSVEHLTDGNAAPVPFGGTIGPMGGDGPMFLGAGDWTARVATQCFWQIEVRPWRGSTGGGGQGFAP